METKKCGKCNTEKVVSDFHRRGSKHQPWCKVCSLKNDREYYVASKTRRENIRNRKKIQGEINQEFILAYLKDHSCIDCGESNPLVLEFDHLRDKKHEISRMICTGYSIESLKQEIEKCDVVCANCHRIRTAKEFKFWKYGVV